MDLKCEKHPEMSFEDQAALDAHMADEMMHPKDDMSTSAEEAPAADEPAAM